MLLFEIHNIAYGWFEVCFLPHSNKACIIENSDYLNCDAPKLLLGSLADLADGVRKEQWLCWQDEPGAHIIHLSLSEENITVGIYSTDKTSKELPYSGDTLKQEIKECRFCNDFEVSYLIDEVLTQFSLYEKGNGLKLYNEHWGNFPQKEYDRLKIYAERLNQKRDKYDEMFFFSY